MQNYELTLMNSFLLEENYLSRLFKICALSDLSPQSMLELEWQSHSEVECLCILEVSDVQESSLPCVVR